MFHHAVMDAAEMRRAAELLRVVAGHERARPALMMELAGGAASVVAGAGAARAGAARAGADSEPEPLESGVGAASVVRTIRCPTNRSRRVTAGPAAGRAAARRAAPGRAAPGRAAARRAAPGRAAARRAAARRAAPGRTAAGRTRCRTSRCPTTRSPTSRCPTNRCPTNRSPTSRCPTNRCRSHCPRNRSRRTAARRAAPRRSRPDDDRARPILGDPAAAASRRRSAPDAGPRAATVRPALGRRRLSHGHHLALLPVAAVLGHLDGARRPRRPSRRRRPRPWPAPRRRP